MEAVQKTAVEKEPARTNEDLKPVTLFKLSMRDLSNVTLVLPLSGLLICFVTG